MKQSLKSRESFKKFTVPSLHWEDNEKICRLRAIFERERHPTKTLEEVTHALDGATVFFKLDLITRSDIGLSPALTCSRDQVYIYIIVWLGGQYGEIFSSRVTVLARPQG